MRQQAADPDSELRRRLADGAAHFGRTLAADAALQAKVDAPWSGRPCCTWSNRSATRWPT